MVYEWWLILSGENQPHLAPCKANSTANLLVKFSLPLLQLSKSLVQCSIQGNFHLVVKAVFFNFLPSLSFYLPPVHLIPFPCHWHTYTFASPRWFLPTCVTCLVPQRCWRIIYPGLCCMVTFQSRAQPTGICQCVGTLLSGNYSVWLHTMISY